MKVVEGCSGMGCRDANYGRGDCLIAICRDDGGGDQ